MDTEPFRSTYGPWALVTGAARREGLGFEFARQLGRLGMNLILVDVLEGEVEARARELQKSAGVHVLPVGLDLGRKGFLSTLTAEVGDREVGLLICNHMHTPTDTPTFLDMELSALDAMLDINARAYTHLIHAFGNAMVSRGKGGIILVSSGASLTAAPYALSYSANKAYQRILGEGLSFELRKLGVDVLVVVSGLLNTQGDAMAGYPQAMVMETEPVVREVLAGLGRTIRVTPGLFNKAVVFFQSRLMTANAAVNQVGRFVARGLRK
ncbi:MAG: SDR family NAD(P)-dependent oxidoreductase [Myxococcota bacterium]